MSIFKTELDAIQNYVANHLRLFILMAAGLVMLVGIVAIYVFFIYLRGAEQTMVPDVEGKELTAALLELQIKELYPRIQLRYSQSSADRGLVLEQTPRAGAIVRAGRRIQLVVSQGVMLSTVENYIGRNIDEVRVDLLTFIPDQTGILGGVPVSQLVSLREPVMYEYSSESAGTVLQQNPEPGASISGPITLDLVVSRGPEHIMTRLPNLVGLDFEDALEQISLTGIDFEFSLRSAQGAEASGTVVSQDPQGDVFASSDTRVMISLTYPGILYQNDVFGLFSYEMALNPYPLLIRLDVVHPNGEQHRLFSVNYAGGRLTIPYVQPAGSVLVLYMLNREIHRETVSSIIGIPPIRF